MKQFFFLFFAIATLSGLRAQTLTLHREVDFPFVTNSLGDVGSSDCWGWTDSTGVDYAIIGNSDHVAFVRASDGQVLDTIQVSDQADGYYHRDFKTHGHYCYAVCEMSGRREGLVVIDLQYLPDSVHFVGAFDASGTMIRSHNLSIDLHRPYAYCESDEAISASGVEIFDLTNPEAPVKVGFVAVPNTHDVYARNDTLWVAEGFTPAYSVYNVTDKGNPILLGRVTHSQFGYCHNIWPSDDGNYFFTTEETPGKTVKVWDAHDMQNIVQRGTYLAPNTLAHNVHVMGHLLVISHYTAGVTVVNWSDPDQPMEIARYDTYTQNDNSSYNGCWGAFPFTSNGYIYASNFNGKLFILNWDELGMDVDCGLPVVRDHCWPNPFTQTTNIPLHLTAATHVAVKAMDITGREVRAVFEGDLAIGDYTLPWHPEGLRPGTYWLHIKTGNISQVKKVVYLGH